MLDIYKNKQNFLFVCPSETWGSRERMALRDCLIAREIGHDVFLYCLKDSLLHIYAKEHRIDCIFHHGKIRTKLYRWHKLSLIKQYIKRLDINLVHCYDLNFLWPICFFLRRNPKVPLIFTFGHEVQKFYKQFWVRPLISRLDLGILPIKEMMDSVRSHIDIPLRKIHFCGLGLYDPKKFKLEMTTIEKDHFVVGTSVGGFEKDLATLKPILHAIQGLNAKKLAGKCIKLILVSQKNWKESLIFPELREFVNANNLAGDVVFETSTDMLKAQSEVDVWVGCPTEEPIEDYTIMAMLSGKPIISPRTAAFMELIREYGQVGEAYKSGDTRELRVKVEKILLNLDKFRSHIKSNRDLLRRYYALDLYKNQLLSHYERMLNRRFRYALQNRS
jgi:glycosyltransferase involved in cell wall biosynthesis